jgi:glycolate oxidase iron-sulfur subunit
MIPEAARCVKCGLCLAECPTYQYSFNEAMSPRGRITLIQALAQGQVKVDRYTHEVLSSCLLCRRCEAMCPSEVPFAVVMDRGRALVRSRQGLKEKLLIALLTRPFLMRLLSRIGKAVLPEAAPLGSVVAQVRPDAPEPGVACFPPEKEPVGRVGLFTGCTGSLFDSAALEGAIALLRHAGYEVRIPREQGCCGALDAHGGNAVKAARLAAINEEAFAGLGELDAVLSIASGCGAQLAGYAVLGEKHADICNFLVQEKVVSRLRFRPFARQVAVHIPCTLENVLHGKNAVLQLLSHIPQLQLERVGRKGSCCGAGGTAFLTRPDIAQCLREPVVQQIAELMPDLVSSSNVSCRLHLQAGAASDGPRYVHPVTLLAQQLIRD